MSRLYENICSKSDEAWKCIETFSNITNNCLLEDEIDSKELYVRILRKVSNFTCDNRQIIMDLQLSENQQCFELMASKMEVCFESHTDKNSEFEDSLKFNESFCADTLEAGKCVIGSLNNCETKTPAVFMRKLFEVISSELPCPKTNWVWE